jgi:hypothetical protein
MRKVRSSTKVGPNTRARVLSSQLGVLDHEANQLLVELHGRLPGAGGTTMMPQSLTTTSATTNAGASTIGDDYTEEELARIFKEQTATIENAFNQPVEEPTSFRRSPPFPVSASAGQKLMQQALPGRQEEDAGSITKATSSGYLGSTAGGPSSTRPASTVFLTGVGEESAVDHARSSGAIGQRESRSQRLEASASALSTGGGGENQAQVGTFGGSAGPTAALAAALEGTLPPIQMLGQPGSRGSSAGGVSRSDPLDMLLKDPGSRAKPMPDIGVREAMKALRAAAMSEYAVAY